MRNFLINSILLLFFVLLAAFYFYVFANWSNLTKIEQPVERITKYDIVLECQKLTATRTTDEFGYKSCLEELEKAAKEDLLKGVEKI